MINAVLFKGDKYRKTSITIVIILLFYLCTHEESFHAMFM